MVITEWLYKYFKIYYKNTEHGFLHSCYMYSQYNTKVYEVTNTNVFTHTHIYTYIYRIFSRSRVKRRGCKDISVSYRFVSDNLFPCLVWSLWISTKVELGAMFPRLLVFINIIIIIIKINKYRQNCSNYQKYIFKIRTSRVTDLSVTFVNTVTSHTTVTNLTPM